MTDLNTDIKAHSKKGGAFVGDIRVRGIDPAQEDVTITVTANYKVGEALKYLLDFISANIGIKYPGAKVDFTSNSSWSKAAVVVRSDEYGSLRCSGYSALRTSTTPRPDNINIFPRSVAPALRGFFAFEPSQSRLTACQLPQRGELLGI